MTVQPSLLTLLEPINPATQVDRFPGIDAPCLCQPGRQTECMWPWCKPDRHPEGERA